MFTKHFNNENTFLVQFKQWEKQLQKVIAMCFKKVRLSKKSKMLQKQRVHNLLDQRSKGIKKNEDEVLKLEEQIKEEEAKLNRKKLIENVKTIKESDVSRGIWKLKEKYFPKQKSSVPVAKKNKEGQLITNEAELKKLYLDNFIHQMSDGPILPELQSYEKEVNEKFKNVLQQTSKEKSPPWNMTELDKVLRKLNLKQSQDL